MAENKIFVERIKELRNEHGISQQELSDKSGVSISIIKLVEARRSGSTKENFQKIADYFKVPLKEIYWEDYRDSTIISITNSKGGCAKTTLVANLSYELSLLDKRVLMVDGDLQCNLSNSYRVEFDVNKSIYKALMDTEVNQHCPDVTNYIIPTGYENLDILAGHYEMATIDADLSKKRRSEDVLKYLMQPLIDKHYYDFIIFDSNTTLGTFNENIMTITNEVIIPVEMSPFGVSGLYKLLTFIRLNMMQNPDLNIFGLFRTKVDNRYNMTKKANILLEKSIEGSSNLQILDVFLSTDSNVSESQLSRLPLSLYVKKAKKQSKAVEEMKKLAKEVLEYVEKQEE